MLSLLYWVEFGLHSLSRNLSITSFREGYSRLLNVKTEILPKSYYYLSSRYYHNAPCTKHGTEIIEVEVWLHFMTCSKKEGAKTKKAMHKMITMYNSWNTTCLFFGQFLASSAETFRQFLVVFTKKDVLLRHLVCQHTC